MIDVQQAYRNAKALLVGKSVLNEVLEFQSGWVFSFALVRGDGSCAKVPQLMALRSTGEVGEFFLPDYLQEVLCANKFTDQQIAQLQSAADNK